VAASAAIGSSAVCLEWSTGRALAAGASEDEIAGVLLAIAPVAGLGRVVSAAPEVAVALGYDIEAALEGPDGHYDSASWRATMTAERPSPRRQTWQPVPSPPGLQGCPAAPSRPR
jgi:hypothetical protein